MSKIVLVTGCAGFIGSHLVDELLGKGFEVVGTDWHQTMQKSILNPKIKFYDLDVRKKQDKKLDEIMEGVDTVFHCAAYAAEIMSLYKPAFITETNVVGSVQMIESAIRQNVERFVFLSSNSIYGYQSKCPYPEEVEKQPDDIYAVGKLATEQMLQILAKVHEMDYTIIRPHNVFGPRQNISDPYRNVIGIWMNRIMRGKKPVVYGDGLQERAFTYIEDLVKPTVKAGTSNAGKNEIFNIGTDENVSLNNAARIVCEAMDFDKGVDYVPGRLQEVKISYPSHEKAKKKLGFVPEWSFEKGVKAMADWVKTQKPQRFKYFKSVEIENKMPITWKNKSL